MSFRTQGSSGPAPHLVMVYVPSAFFIIEQNLHLGLTSMTVIKTSEGYRGHMFQSICQAEFM